ncbi:FbpB family small basic protein [Bacillus sp. AK031]
MKKGQMTIAELLRKNKEELLLDKVKIEKIEMRLDEKLVNNSK